MKKEKFASVKKIYSLWAENYDNDRNIPIFLEEKATKSLLKNIKDKKILDLGCGTGRYAIPLAKKGAKVTAVDFSKEMISIAKKKAKENKLNVTFITENITKFVPKLKYDLIISMLVLDYVKNLGKIIDIFNKASKKGTKVVISNLHHFWIYQARAKYKREVGYTYKDRNYFSDQYLHFPEEYVDLFYKKGFALVKMKENYFEEKYQKIKVFKEKAKIFANKPIGIIMVFEKIR